MPGGHKADSGISVFPHWSSINLCCCVLPAIQWSEKGCRVKTTECKKGISLTDLIWCNCWHPSEVKSHVRVKYGKERRSVSKLLLFTKRLSIRYFFPQCQKLMCQFTAKMTKSDRFSFLQGGRNVLLGIEMVRCHYWFMASNQ